MYKPKKNKLQQPNVVGKWVKRSHFHSLSPSDDIDENGRLRRLVSPYFTIDKTTSNFACVNVKFLFFWVHTSKTKCKMTGISTG